MPTEICGQSAASLRQSAATGVSPNLLRAGHSLAAGADSVRQDTNERERGHARLNQRLSCDSQVRSLSMKTARSLFLPAWLARSPGFL
jgi:hypothetical protein